jgi:branched-chain amino acid transport system permease protein
MNVLGNLLPHLVNGVSLGLLFALIALGFMLIIGLMETINLAHGSLFALGMYAALFLAAPRLGWFPEARRGTCPCRLEPDMESPCFSRR